MADFDAILRCSVASTALQLLDYSVSDRLRSGGGREITISLTGEVVTDDADTAAAAQAEVLAAIKSASGQDFTVYGPGDVVICRLTRSQCRDGGPHVSVELKEMAAAGLMHRAVSFTVSTDRSGATGGGSSGGGVSTTLRVTKSADGRGTIAQSGSISGSGLSDAAIESAVFGPFTAAYARPNFVIVAREYELNEDGSEATYQIQAQYLASPLPGTAEVVDGEASRSVERDDRRLKTTRYDFDLLLSGGDPQPVLDAIRPAGIIQAESYTISLHRESRLRATFTVIEGGDGTPVTEWRQQARMLGGAGTVEERRYAGLQPLLIAAPAGTPTVSQTGKAVAVGRAVQPPEPILADRLAAAPEVTVEEQGIGIFVTSWSYLMFAESYQLGQATGLLASLARRPSSFTYFPGVGDETGGGA